MDLGRTMKRVPMDFDYPLGEKWKGYLNEHYVPCSDCEGGWSREYKYLEKRLYGYQVPKHEDLQPFVPDMEKLEVFLLHEQFGSVHEALVRKGKELGIPDDWYSCRTCDGDGVHPDAQVAYHTWTPTEPPIGDGYQLWETTSEGSPKSPVFPTLETLCEWCETHATTFSRYTATKEEWLRMLNDGSVCHQQGDIIFL